MTETTSPDSVRDRVSEFGLSDPVSDAIQVVLAAAKRDPTEFDHPERLDISRAHNPHLGFGPGAHHRLGASLAQLEGEIALSVLFERFSGVRLAADPAEIGPCYPLSMQRLSAHLASEEEGR